jgi:hypothetical protein
MHRSGDRARHAVARPQQEAPNKKPTDPDVVGWFLGGQKSTRAGQFFLFIFDRVFELPSPRNAQKLDKTKTRTNRFWIFWSFFCKKRFDTIFL